jgi:hypothetical protein
MKKTNKELQKEIERLKIINVVQGNIIKQYEVLKALMEFRIKCLEKL